MIFGLLDRVGSARNRGDSRRVTLVAMCVAVVSALLAVDSQMVSAATTQSTLSVTKTADRGAAPESASVMASTLTVPVTTEDDADVSMTTAWSTTRAKYVSGSAVAPAGWDVEYYDGTSWSSTEPADPSVVQKVRTSGSVRSMGDGGNNNTLLTDSLSASKYTGPPGSFGASVGGDGYNLAFPDTERVVNVFHHNGPTQGVDVVFDCHLRSSGDTCPEGQITMTGYRLPNNTVVAANATSKRVFAPAYRESDGVLGFVCADYSLSTPAKCATEFIAVSAYSAMTSRNDIGGVAADGDRIFVVNGVNSRLYCLNMLTSSICSGFGDQGGGVDGFQLPSNSFEGPLGAPGRGWTSDISVIGGKVYFFAGNRPQNQMGCVNPSTAAYCGGNAPISFGNQTPFDFPPIPLYDTSGVLAGVCVALNLFCITPNGSASTTMSSALQTFLTPLGGTAGRIGYFGAYGVYLSLLEWAVVDQRLYLPVEAGGAANAPWLQQWPSDLACWDFSTGAPCVISGHDGFIIDVTPGNSLYSAVADPYSECVWVNSDTGHIIPVATDGSQCGGTSAEAEFTFDETAARLDCDSQTDVLSWKTLTLTLPSEVSLSNVELSLLDSDGDVVTGWDSITPSSTTIDLTGIALSLTGTKPTFVVRVKNSGLPVVTKIKADLEMVTSSPQLCVQLLPVATCTTGKAVGGYLAISSFPVSGETSVTASGSPVTESVSSSVTSADFDAGTLCGTGDIAGRATEQGSSLPLGGVKVRVRDRSTGAVVATTTTDSQGRYLVTSLTPGDYTVEFGDKGTWSLVDGRGGVRATVVTGSTGRASAVYKKSVEIEVSRLSETGAGFQGIPIGLLMLGLGLLLRTRSLRRVRGS